MHPGRPSRALLRHAGGGGTKQCNFVRFSSEQVVPFGMFRVTFSAVCCVIASRALTNEGPGGTSKLDHFVEKKEIIKTQSSQGSTSDLNYQSLLDEHILDNLELAILSCEISNLEDIYT